MAENARTRIAAAAYDLGKYFYQGPIRPLIQRSGLKRLYKALILRSIGEWELSVGDRHVSFLVDTMREWKHLETNTERELTVINDFLDRLRSDDVVYDIGANIGVYAVLAATVTNKTVIAVEPAPYNIKKVYQNADHNDVSVAAYQFALSDTDGTATFGVDSRGVAGSGHGSLERTSSSTTTVETRRGDSLIAEGEIPPPTVVKIDVEGAELAVIDGLESALSADRCRLVFVEVHEGHAATEAVTERLERFGFECDSISGEKRFHLRATK